MGRDLWPAAALAITGLVAINEARKLRIGSVAAPGPGFFPLLLALALALVGLVLVVRALRAGAGAWPSSTSSADAPTSPATQEGGRLKVAATMTALGLYAFTLEPLGFLVSTFGLLLFFFRALESQRWWVAVAGSVATSFATYVVFKVWLQVRLPSGVLGL